MISTSLQTEPILVPFPLPPIGKVQVAIETSSTATQTEYTWMFNEFPFKDTSLPQDTSVPATPEMVSTRVTAQVTEALIPSPKKSRSPKKSEAKPAVAAVTPMTAPVASPKTAPAVTPMTAPVASPKTAPAFTPLAAPGASPKTAPSFTPVAPTVAEVETTTPIATKKMKKNHEVIHSPTTTAVPETPSETSPAPTKIKKKASFIKPVISDESDAEDFGMMKSFLSTEQPALTRTITPVQVKPTVPSEESPATKPKVEKKKQVISKADSSSEDETLTTPLSSLTTETAGAESSSGDSDTEMPSVSTILTTPTSTKRKQQSTTPSTPTTPQRHGPFIQIENVTADQVEDIKAKMLNLIPENSRNGAIKCGVHDSDSNRLIVQLRITPKVVHYFSVNGGILSAGDDEKKMTVLTESQKKKVLPLFHSDSQETQPPAPITNKKSKNH